MSRPQGSRRLWVFDFDGTLSPLVPDRSAAALDPACGEMIAELSRRPLDLVAVLSSRAIDDLAPRIPFPSVVLGGGSGLEWQLPGGVRVSPGDEAERELADSRARMASWVDAFRAVRGVDVEDKRWSVAIHYRHAPPGARGALATLLEDLKGRRDLRVFAGPEAAEVQLLRGVDKSLGMERLCRVLRFDPSAGGAVYAGDDEGDAAAMRWVMARKGVAFAVGGRVSLRGAIAVAGPPELAAAVRAMAGVPPRRRNRAEKGGAAG